MKLDRTSPPKTFKSFPINDLKVFQEIFQEKHPQQPHFGTPIAAYSLIIQETEN
ncbi:hypothetical protein [Chlorobaculum parvum]|uniref:hypothetical protein n=1 Tax=Chlorobaculum parvum TaxID=274539 RepID=UPI0018DE9493|nr:hypothetical protein [Chlorobaculum parvum]